MKSFIRHITNIVNVFLPVTRFFRTRSFLLQISGVTLGENTKVCGGGLVYGRGDLIIGNDSWISSRSTFYTHLDSIIKIGKCCDIGPEVRFITGSHKIGGFDRRAGEGFSSPIIIEDGCWIGAGVTILCGVTIGEGSVIGAGAVVTCNVPKNSLFAGVPAQYKKDLQ